MCYYYDYSTGQTTDPKFVAAIIDIIRGSLLSDPEISVVESDASAMKCRYAFKMLGYEKMSKEKKVTLVNLTEDQNEEITMKIANQSFKFSVPQTIKNAHLFINVPKIKYMKPTKISCALKNVYGCNPLEAKFRYHPFLDEVIVGLNKIMKPKLCIIDGIIVRGRYTKKLDLVMASTDSVATDSVAAKIAGLNPKKVHHITLAEKEGLGKTSYRVVGESIQYFAKRFPQKDMKAKIGSNFIDFGLFILKKLGRARIAT